ELHALVNNAAISPKAEGGKRLTSIDTALEMWNHVFRVNFFAPIMLARGLLDELKAAKGSVVNVTSIAGSRVHPFAGAAYATSKAALAALTREMAADFGPLGIRVNATRPGETDTAMLSPGTEEIVAHQIPMHRLGTPDEVAKIIYVLCTETASYVNGAEIHINGGQHVYTEFVGPESAGSTGRRASTPAISQDGLSSAILACASGSGTTGAYLGLRASPLYRIAAV